MSAKQNNDKVFKNPDPINVLNALKTINAINKFILENDLSNYFKSVASNVKYMKQIILDFSDISTYIQKCEIIKNSSIHLIDTLTYIDDYTKNKLSEFEAISIIQETLNSFVDIFNINIDPEKFKNMGAINSKLSDMVFDLISDLYYIGMMATANEKAISDGLNILMGEDTAAYIPLLNSSATFEVSNNNSLLYKYFLLNEVLSQITELKFSKMGWVKKIIFFNFTIKDSIRRIINTITYFYRQTDKIAKVMDEGDKAIEQVSTRATMAFGNFSSFIENLVGKDYGLMKIVKARRKIRSLIGLYKYFLKQIIKLAKEYQKFSKIKPRKGITLWGHNFFGREEGYVSLDVLEPIENVMKSIFTAVQTADAAAKIGFWKSFKIKRRIKTILNTLINIPRTISDNVDKEHLEYSIEAINSYTNLIKLLIEISNSISTLEYDRKKALKLVWFVESLFNNQPDNVGIIELINQIDQKNIEAADDRVKLVKNIFDNIFQILKITKDSFKSISNLTTFNLIILPIINSIIKKISEIKITKNTKQNFSNMTDIMQNLTDMISNLAIIGKKIISISLSLLTLLVFQKALVLIFWIIKYINKRNATLKAGLKNIILLKAIIISLIGIYVLMSLTALALPFIGIAIICMFAMITGLIPVILFIFVLSKLNTMTLIKATLVLLITAGTLYLLSITLLLMSKNAEKINFKALLIFLGVMIILIAVFALIGLMTPVIILSLIGAGMMLLVGVSLLLLLVPLLMIASVKTETLETAKTNAELVMQTALDIIKSFVEMGAKINGLEHKKEDSWVEKALKNIAGSAINIIEAICAFSFIAYTFLTISLICLTALELTSLNKIDLSEIKQAERNVGIIFGVADSVINAVCKKPDTDKADTADEKQKKAFKDILKEVGKDIFKGVVNVAESLLSFGYVAFICASVGIITLIAKNLDYLSTLTLNNKSIVANTDTVLTTAKSVSEKFKGVKIDKSTIHNAEHAKDLMRKLAHSAEWMAKIGKFNKSGEFNSAINSYVNFIDKVNTVKIENLKTATNMFAKMAEFSESINGNFEGLSEVINEKIIGALEQLNTTLGDTNNKIGVLKEISDTLNRSGQSGGGSGRGFGGGSIGRSTFNSVDQTNIGNIAKNVDEINTLLKQCADGAGSNDARIKTTNS